MNDKLYVQYGCGMSAPEGWRNFDASPTLRFERIPLVGRIYTKNTSRFPDNVEYGNIIAGLPIKDGSCRAVYCSHVLEHLALEDFRIALRNTYSMLQKEGIFRFVVPDLEQLIKSYLNNASVDAALVFMKKTGLGKEKRRSGLQGVVLERLGNSNHLWMWDFKSVEQELLNAGFQGIRRAVYGDSVETKYIEVEDALAWNDSLGVECKK